MVSETCENLSNHHFNVAMSDDVKQEWTLLRISFGCALVYLKETV